MSESGQVTAVGSGTCQIKATANDVNGDGRVSVTDVISMNSYILEEEPAQFIRKVADMNGDGKVTITDMVQVIDIILGR